MASLRVEELFKYFQATSHAVALREDDIDSVQAYRPDLARLSQDPVLNALTQLGVARLGCDRAFVSLIDDENQYVVAEMTKSISLFRTSLHGQNDGLCIGTRQLDLVAGICASTMPAFTSVRDDGQPFRSEPNVFADSTRYIINDLTQEPQFADRPYVVGYPYMRYYAEVPITSRSGFVLGTYAILDNAPGHGLSEEKYNIMHEVSEAIMRHLESIKLQEDYAHAMRLLSSLNTFVQTTSDSFEQDGRGNESPVISSSRSFPRRKSGRRASCDGECVLQLPPGSTNDSSVGDSTDGIDSDVGLFDQQNSSGTTLISTYPPTEALPHRASDVNGIAPAQDKPEESLNDQVPVAPVHVIATDTAKGNTDVREFDLAEATHACFARAAGLLREALKLEGVVFLDTKSYHSEYQIPTSPRGSVGTDAGGSMTTSSGQEVNPYVPASRARDTGSLPGSKLEAALCRRLGIAIRGVASSDAEFTPPTHFTLPEALHQDLLCLRPGGCVFNFNAEDDTCVLDTTRAYEPDLSIHGVRREIAQHFPSARSLIFVPLWNSHADGWFAGCIAWSTDRRRILEASENSYLKGFGNSVMVEVARLELLATNQAKSDFISCISHELRSPLHGILGSTELLKESALPRDQKQLVSMVDSCARILLETMDNILFYSKINSVVANEEYDVSNSMVSVHSKRSDRVSGALSDFDLGTLIEETCGALVAGHQYTNSTRNPNDSPVNGHKETVITSNSSSGILSADSVTMILRMDCDAAQVIRSRSAAWRRCLLNIVGNAYKYTTTGYVEITLQRTSLPNLTASEQYKEGISLTVRDTGCGIGKSYLENHLFRPFVQENVHSSGTGLGLSIVKSLVDDLQGSVAIESDVGVGTEVTVTIPTGPVFQSESVSRNLTPYNRLSICFVGFDLYPHLAEPVTGTMSPTAKGALAIKNALFTHCEQWLGMKCSSAQNCLEASADILVVSEDNVSLVEEENIQNGPAHEPALHPVRLILCTRYGTKGHVEHKTTNKTAYLLQPFGPRHLTSVIDAIYRSRSEQPSTHGNKAALIDDTAPSRPQHPDTSHKRARYSCPTDEITDPAGPESDQESSAKYVLLVDDNDVNLKLIARCVRQLNCRYVTATNGQEAFEAFKTSDRHFDYVFMDISMPVMDGFESARAIRDFEKQNNRAPTPIIAMTGLGSEAARTEAVSSGMSTFWTKPVKMKTVKSFIEDSDQTETSVATADDTPTSE